MNILTDEEIAGAIGTDRLLTSEHIFARAIEAAILKKLAEQAGEPVVIEEPDYHYEAMGCGLEDRNITDRYEAMEHGWNCAIERMFEQILDELLYTEAQCLAAQQRTAEACIKAVSEEYLTDPHDATDDTYNLALDHAIGGMKQWMEYL